MPRPTSLYQLGEDPDELATINALIYSHPGEGKTVLWGTGGPQVMIMDADSYGAASALAMGSKAFRLPVTDFQDLWDAYEFIKNDNAREPQPFGWVVWDSLTLWQNRSLIDEVMPDAVAANPKQEEFVPSRREYLINMNRTMRMIRNFAELPVNFGVSCHIMLAQDENGDGSVYMPAVQGKGMPSNVCGYMNVVGYLGKQEVLEAGQKKVVQTCRFRREGKYYAKDRFDALGAVMARPTLPKIEAAIVAKKALMAESKAATPAATSTPVRRRRVAQKNN